MDKWKEEPNDIDLVSFVPYENIQKNESGFSQFSYPNSIDQFGVDAYIVKVYPDHHKYYAHFVADSYYWKEQFGRTRRNRSGKRYSKGFLEIKF